MRVKDKETGLILESKNPLVIEQWLKNPGKYVLPKKASTPSKGEKSNQKPKAKR